MEGNKGERRTTWGKGENLRGVRSNRSRMGQGENSVPEIEIITIKIQLANVLPTLKIYQIKIMFTLALKGII